MLIIDTLLLIITNTSVLCLSDFYHKYQNVHIKNHSEKVEFKKYFNLTMRMQV